MHGAGHPFLITLPTFKYGIHRCRSMLQHVKRKIALHNVMPSYALVRRCAVGNVVVDGDRFTHQCPPVAAALV